MKSVAVQVVKNAKLQVKSKDKGTVSHTKLIIGTADLRGVRILLEFCVFR